MRITFSWDDGALEDLRLFELHEKYKVPGIFFIPTRNREGRTVLSKEMIKGSESEYVEFGAHTENHVYLTEISPELVESEVRNNKDYLEEILGHEIKHFCLPGGKYNEKILETCSNFFQTIRTADTMNFNNKDRKIFRPSFHLYPRGKKSLIANGVKNGSYREAIYILRNFSQDELSLYYRLLDVENNQHESDVIFWGHSWEIEQLGLWGRLEELFEKVMTSYANEVISYSDFIISSRSKG